MLSVLVVSENGEGYGLATKLAKEKNFVKFCSSNTQIGTGIKLPKRTNTINPEEEQDLTIFLQNTVPSARVADGMGKMGRAVIGSGGLWGKLLEDNFRHQFELLLGTHEVTEEGEFEVYRFFNADLGYLPFYITNYATRRMMDGNWGSEIQSSSNTVTVSTQHKYGSVFDKIETFLHKAKFAGVIGFLFKEKALWGIIVQLSLGMLYALMELCYFSLTELLMATIYSVPFTGKFRAGIGMSILVTMAPYPAFLPCIESQHDYIRLNSESEKHFVTEDLYMIEDNRVCGETGILGWATAHGVNAREARRRTYRTINNIAQNRSLQFRTDIGTNVDDVLFQFIGGNNAIVTGKEQEGSVGEHRGTGAQL